MTCKVAHTSELWQFGRVAVVSIWRRLYVHRSWRCSAASRRHSVSTQQVETASALQRGTRRRQRRRHKPDWKRFRQRIRRRSATDQYPTERNGPARVGRLMFTDPTTRQPTSTPSC